ncbi:MAG TPA: DJ-1/PfpI family protein [Trebonia sp.]|jgi:protease I|nr:DJ-1/PfpI family protein [Trebonia sp.]
MSDTILRSGPLVGCRVAILIESDFYEPEIFYYQRRFAEEGCEVDFRTRMWGQSALSFTGHEYRAPFTANLGVEDVSDDELRGYDALIVPSGIVADRLRYTEDITRLAPAAELLQRAFAEPGLIKGIICHGMWLASPIAATTVHGRKVVCHNNLIGDVRNMGAEYVDQDVVIDGDLITGRTGGHCHLFARTIIDRLIQQRNL